MAKTVPTVLVVADDPVLRELLAERMAAAGCRPDRAAAGEVTPRRVAGRRPDLVVVDRWLRGDEGPTLAARLRARHLPVIVVGAPRAEATPDGAASVPAPIDLGRLDTLVAETLGRRAG